MKDKYLLIKNAEIFDNRESFFGCVLIKDEHIEAVLPSVPEDYTGEVLDAEGKALSSGFIDSHSHNDFFIASENNHKYFEPLALQGITTLVSGNCGHSASGYSPDTPYHQYLSGLFPSNPNYKDYASFAEFFDICDEHSPLNIACICGHGTVQTSVRGLGGNPVTSDQQKEIDLLIEQSLEQGAAGISYGLMYDPDMFATEKMLISASKIAKRYDKPITFHMRACSAISTSYPSLFGRPHNLRAMDEAIHIARQSGAKAHLSHIIYVGKRSWSTLDESIQLIDDANNSGLDITFDIYPFDFGASCINVILPAWYQKMENKRGLLTRIRLFFMVNGAKKMLGLSYNDLEITDGAPQKYIGKRVDEIANELGKSGLAAYLQVIDDTDAKASIHMYKYMNPHIINTLSNHPRAMFMTDAWVLDTGIQNLSAYGSFPRFLRLSREGNAAPLPDLLHKMTAAVAERFSLKNRGRVQPGYFADIVIFDKDTAKETTCESHPIGINHVIVNGEFAVKNGVYTSQMCGKGLRV